MSQPPLHTSPGLHAVLTRLPSWPERWGTLLVAGLLGALLAGAGLVRYADVVTVPFAGLASQAAPGEVAVWASLPPAAVPTVRPGQSLQLVLAGNPPGLASPVTGQVVALAPRAAAGRYRLFIRLGQVPPSVLSQQSGNLLFTMPAASLLSRMWKPSAPASDSRH
jgi:hypothetical protein